MTVKKLNVQRSSTYPKEFLIAVYKEMLYYRRFEEAVNRAYTQGKFAGFCHLHIGQEAVCVGVQKALVPEDYVISGYRSHTQSIAKGLDPKTVMAELFGKVGGCVKGKGGSMHMFSKEHRFLGGHGIVGGQVPLATGAAFKIRYKNEDLVSVCYLGDGAVQQGQFYESLNLAATWNLPVLYIIENNQFGMGTNFRRVTSVDRLCKRALAFDMSYSDCDGMNFLNVYEHVKPIVEKMRKDKKPHLLEALTYRYRGHSVSDPGTYRSKEDVQRYMDKDPLKQMSSYLEEQKHCSASELEAWDEDIRKQIKDVEKFADESPEPGIEVAYQDIFVD